MKQSYDDNSISELNKSDDNPISIQECLEEFLSVEKLEESDSWYCSKCKDHRPAKKKIDIWKLPNVLIIHLKRFEQQSTGLTKIQRLVKFPLLDFDLKSYAGDPNEENFEYDLYGCLNHFGSLGGGHYTSFAKNHELDKWYYFDDSRCTNSDFDKIQGSPVAYLLFYVKKNFVYDIENLRDSLIDVEEIPTQNCVVQ